MDEIKKIMNKMLLFSKKYDKYYNWFIFSCLFMILFYVGIHHEPFRDEVQAWNMARDLSVVDIFKQMRWEGHPCLWHLILKPLTMLGLPIYSMTWVSSIIMLITGWLILFKSPFPKLVRTVLIFSSPFLYFYSIISRSYSLIALFITLLCIFYNKRKEYPLVYGLLLLLLFNTHVIMVGMASILLLFFIVETISNSFKTHKFDKKGLIGCFIGFLGGLFLVLQILGSYETNSLVDSFGVDTYNYTKISEYINFFIREYKNEYFCLTNYHLTYPIIMPIIILLIISVVTGIIYNTKNTIIFCVSYLFSLFVCIFLFYSIPSRSVIIIFTLMFLLWISEEEGRKVQLFPKYIYLVQLLLLIYSLITIPYGIECSKNDVDRLMTDAPVIAEFIKENITETDIILTTDENLTTVILGYIPGYKFYNIENERYYTFITWDLGINFKYDIDSFNKLVNRFNNDNGDIYFLHTSFVLNHYRTIISELEADGRASMVYKSDSPYVYLNSAQEYVTFYVYKLIK